MTDTYCQCTGPGPQKDPLACPRHGLKMGQNCTCTMGQTDRKCPFHGAEAGLRFDIWMKTPDAGREGWSMVAIKQPFEVAAIWKASALFPVSFQPHGEKVRRD